MKTKTLFGRKSIVINSCDCEECNGRGMVTCDACDGEGEREETVQDDHPRFSEIEELVRDKEAVNAQAERMMKLKPEYSRSYEQQADRACNEIDEKIGELMKQKTAEVRA